MIVVRAYGYGTDGAGAIAVAIEQPVGVQDGDLLLAGIALHSANVVITPPPGWTFVQQTDPTLPTSVAVFAKTALNEGARWVFNLSSACTAHGVVVAYAGCDGWEPVEAFVLDAASSSTSAPIGNAVTSLGDEEIIAFLAMSTSGPPTAPDSTYSFLAGGDVGSTDLSVWRAPMSAPGELGAKVFTAVASCNSASIALTLRPSDGTLTTDDTRGILLGGFPKGVDRVYDLQPGGDFYNLFQASAQATKESIFDLVDLARRESQPATSVIKLPDWEDVLGLTATTTAKLGTVPQRQAQVVAALRDAAGLGSTQAAVNAIIGPLLGYFATTPVQIITTDRDLLRIAHSYSPSALVTVTSTTPFTYYFNPVDGGKVSAAGARVTLEYGTKPSLGAEIEVSLTAPDGRSDGRSFIYSGEDIDQLSSASIAGAAMTGAGRAPFTAEIFVGTGSMTVIPTVFVEGVDIALNSGQETAAAMFEWGVYADPAHLGENGTPANFAAARFALSKLAFVWGRAQLIQSIAPYPDTTSGANSAIPDECIPA